MLLRRGYFASKKAPRSPSLNVDDSDRAGQHKDAVTLHRKPWYKKKLWIAAIVLLAIASGGGGFAFWRLFVWQPAVVNPFDTKTIAAAHFPLYYPTQLPAGFRIDTKTVTVPQDGVVVFNMVGPKGVKLYMSEEARPTKFDLGGFYKKFQDLEETGVSDGAIATGRLSGGQTEVTSRANNKTWVLSNTSARVPLDQLTNMMKSLTLSY
jgi:hypothetical protein